MGIQVNKKNYPHYIKIASILTNTENREYEVEFNSYLGRNGQLIGEGSIEIPFDGCESTLLEKDKKSYLYGRMKEYIFASWVPIEDVFEGDQKPFK